jgi:hypothetical protein
MKIIREFPKPSPMFKLILQTCGIVALVCAVGYAVWIGMTPHHQAEVPVPPTMQEATANQLAQKISDLLDAHPADWKEETFGIGNDKLGINIFVGADPIGNSPVEIRSISVKVDGTDMPGFRRENGNTNTTVAQVIIFNAFMRWRERVNISQEHDLQAKEKAAIAKLMKEPS